MRTLIATLLLLSGTAGSRLVAQDPAAALDSLAERLERAEQTIELLQRQLEEQSQAKVGSRLRNRVTLAGLIITNAFHNNARVNNSDVPQFVVAEQDTTGLPNRHLGGAIRQSRLGLTVSGVQTMNASLTAELELDFFGGQQPGTNNRTSPLLRLRTATARLDWAQVSVMVGQESPLVSPHNPVSFASSGIPGFAGAGNLWLWIPQARLSYETSPALPQLGIQAAAVAPMTPSPQGFFLTQADSAEKSARPALQARAYAAWGAADAPSQVGIGIHRGWIATTGDSLLTSEALTADWRVALGDRLVIVGEAFQGRALGGLGGGGIGQNLGLSDRPVRTRGGWVQVNLRPTLQWEWGGGAGLDDPYDSDLPTTGRLRNLVYAGHVNYRPGGGLLLGFEFRRIETRYATGTFGANHLNWFAGVAF